MRSECTSVADSADTNTLVSRKYQLMKMMLANEKKANQLIKDKIANLSANMHANNGTVNGLAKMGKAADNVSDCNGFSYNNKRIATCHRNFHDTGHL